MGGGLSPSVGQAATRLDPPMDTIHAHHCLVGIRFRLGITFLIRKAFPRSTRHAGPFPFETPRIPKSDGLRANPLRHMNRLARERHFITAATACSAQASRKPYCTFSQGGPPTCERKPPRPTSRIRYTGLRWVRERRTYCRAVLF